MSRKAEKEKVGGGESSKSTGRSGEDVEGCMRVCVCVCVCVEALGQGAGRWGWWVAAEQGRATFKHL